VLPIKYSVNNEDFAFTPKQLQRPLKTRPAHIVGMFNFQKTEILLVYEDAVVMRVQNEDSIGFLGQAELKIPFDKVSSALFEPSSGILLL